MASQNLRGAPNKIAGKVAKSLRNRASIPKSRGNPSVAPGPAVRQNKWLSGRIVDNNKFSRYNRMLWLTCRKNCLNSQSRRFGPSQPRPASQLSWILSPVPQLVHGKAGRPHKIWLINLSLRGKTGARSPRMLIFSYVEDTQSATVPQERHES